MDYARGWVCDMGDKSTLVYPQRYELVNDACPASAPSCRPLQLIKKGDDAVAETLFAKTRTVSASRLVRQSTMI